MSSEPSIDPIRIGRDPRRATDERFDLIVVGGGIYGVAATLEAARRGLRPLLVERRDFGAATSANSLRVIHGGFRYLQSGDLVRFRQSVRERRWFLRHFPDLVKPLACLLPLYGRGLQRTSLLRAGLLANELLSFDRNRDVVRERWLPSGRLLDAEETRSSYPLVAMDGLQGGALWYDAVMTSSERVLMEMLRWAVHRGATALNYVEATELRIEGPRVTGVEARDLESDEVLELRAPVVLNCAGPWSRTLAKRFDTATPELFPRAMAFNLLLDREPVANTAIAVSPPEKNARSYFLLPWKGRILAGTYHLPWHAGEDDVNPTNAQLDAFVSDLNRAVPGLGARSGHILRVYSGLQPARADGEPEVSRRPVLLDHAVHGGPHGLHSLAGVKYTTARHVAEAALRQIYGTRGEALRAAAPRPTPAVPPGLDDAVRLLDLDAEEVACVLRRLGEQEAAIHVDDLIFRRMDGLYEPEQVEQMAEIAFRALDLNDSRRAKELERLRPQDDSMGAGGTP